MVIPIVIGALGTILNDKSDGRVGNWKPFKLQYC